jgi:hypothetical protein
MASLFLPSRSGKADQPRAGGNHERHLAHPSLPQSGVARLADDEQPGRGALPRMLRLRQGAGQIRHGQQRHPGRLTGRRTYLCHEVVLPVAWTLADPAGLILPGPDQIAEALGMQLQRGAA